MIPLPWRNIAEFIYSSCFRLNWRLFLDIEYEAIVNIPDTRKIPLNGECIDA
jgi:hypothetical protein